MAETRILAWLCALIGGLALVAAGVGVFASGNGTPVASATSSTRRPASTSQPPVPLIAEQP
jgi:hypothetical protein